ncbi:MAG: glycerophosphodiester phosphodiesterase [Salinarimonas sp.]|nr:glycerophosphodiester phosphodiesterase [Salinarimonas sp.]
MKSTLPPPATAAWLTSRPIAHRGLHDRAGGVIENSMNAARSAIAGGYGIECDVQDSVDGEAFVFHDHDLGRLTGGDGAFCECSARMIDDLRLSDADGDARIPRLADFLNLVGGKVPLVVEIKSRFDGNPALTGRCIALLRDYDGPVCVKSFDPQVVAWLRRDAPQIMRGIVADAAGSGPPGPGSNAGEAATSARHARAHLLHIGETLPDFVSWHASDLPHAAPFLCRSLRGMPVLTWTLRSAEQAAFVRAHADQIVFEGFRP